MKIVGYLSDRSQHIDGRLSLLKDDISGSLMPVHDSITGIISLTKIPKTYTGPMEFTPSSETRIIGVEDLYLPGNIVLNPIPQNYGLVTWNGSYLTIS